LKVKRDVSVATMQAAIRPPGRRAPAREVAGERALTASQSVAECVIANDVADEDEERRKRGGSFHSGKGAHASGGAIETPPRAG